MLLPRPQGAHLFSAQLARLGAAAREQDLALGAPAKAWGGCGGGSEMARDWDPDGVQNQARAESR